MDLKKTYRGFAVIVVCYIFLAILFHWVLGDQLSFRDNMTVSVSPAEPVGEITDSVTLRQRFRAEGDELTGLLVRVSVNPPAQPVRLVLELQDPNGTVIGRTEQTFDGPLENEETVFRFSEPVPLVRGEAYDLVISSPDGKPGDAVSLWMGNSVSLARADVPKIIAEEERLVMNGVPLEGMLVCSIQTRSYSWFGRYYSAIAAVGGLLLVLACLYYVRQTARWRMTALHRLVNAFQKYNFLMRQLIARDFKTKYKRSVLGVLWSFLNPLLTMSVQYLVFSMLFKSDIPNFPLYLLSGIVCFNFFNEATTMALMSIIGNAQLITKVYVPKYIFPVSRVLSSTINLLISMIPLFFVMLITRAPISRALLVLPFGILCLVLFCIGLGLILSTLMVFFRDTQFLWGVLSMLWMYLTPIFYPESIIPERFLGLFRCNPLYHILRFVRSVVIEGISPEPIVYFHCILVAILPLLLGVYVFKRHQDQLILNL